MTDAFSTLAQWESGKKPRSIFTQLKEVWEYRYLVLNLARTSLIASHRQTLLGSVWMLLKPLLMVVIYLFLFVKIMRVSTGGMIPFLFYLASNTLWYLFSEAFRVSSSSVAGNASVWNKIYYPRLVSPVSSLLYVLFTFAGQFIILIVAMIIYGGMGELVVYPARLSWALLAMCIALSMAFGAGLILSVWSTKYRDLNMLNAVALRALLFITPVLYTFDKIPAKWKWFAQINPLTAVFELFRCGLLNGPFPPAALLTFSLCTAALLLLFGLHLFAKKADSLLELA